MKKFFLTLGVAAMCLSSYAGTRILYQQDFETAEKPDATGWSYNGGSLTIGSDDFGKFIELALGQNNGRTGYVQWGDEIFQNADGESILEDGTYTVQFDFSIKTNSNNQYNSEITLYTTAKGTDNQPFRGRWSGDTGPWCNYLWDAYQANTAADADMLAAINAPYKKEVSTDDEGVETITYSVDLSDPKTLATGNWYTVTCNVDVNNRTVDYTVEDISGTMLDSGTREVPETSLNADQTPVSMYALGLWVMTARYQCTMCFDNIKVYFESEYDYANVPTIALTGLGKVADEDGEDVVNLNARTYTITFMEGETLHVEAPGAAAQEIEYDDCEGNYTFTTTTSGTLKAWTTSGDATSEVVSVEVDATPCALPAAEATISSVEAGFAKTFTLSVDNANVPLRPTIFINYEFTPSDGGAVIKEEGLASGAKVTVPSEGWLTMTTQAFGYQETSHSIKNDMEFAVKTTYDFAHMSQEDLTAAGFTTWTTLNSSSTSGFSNWTARKRLYYYDSATATKDEETGETTYTAVYPFGYVSEDGPVLNYSEVGVEGDDLGINVAGYELFPGVSVYAGHNVTALLHIGMVNNATGGGNNKNIDVYDLDNSDFVVINRINDYGSNSNHPIVATVEEYYAQLEGANEVYSVAQSGTLNEETGKYTISLPVYRIDTAANKVTVYSLQGEAGIENVAAEAAENNDPYYYTIDGLRLEKPTHAGLYIHKGKKVIIK